MRENKGKFVWVGENGNAFYCNSTSKDRIKYNKQRAKTMVGDDETFALDKTLAVFIIPRLQRYREVMNGFPIGLTMEEWMDIVDEIIWLFEQIEDGICAKNMEEAPEYYKRVEEAQILFGKYLTSLWW